MFPDSIQNLINNLSKLPDIGPRAATRLVFHLLNQKQKELTELSSLIKSLKSEIELCGQCFNLTSKDQLCSVCQDKKRDPSKICIVETPLNILPIEKTKQFNGLYHVLGGLIFPSNGIGPEKLKINQLITRCKNNQSKITELIFALSPSTEGDTTTLYIERLLKPLKIKTSRLARGLSMGSDLEYIDEHTLSSALRERK
ncbi:MAG: recombination protein RecR [Parcubacteria group bacterium]|jgi:recombination protein RecR|nr:recombination protein RecR [Parcubacteria group bacterium]|tara:strand:- start:20461 stop:21057 length:597 start_codon:yes stop_codon:yes gene_type:complete